MNAVLRMAQWLPALVALLPFTEAFACGHCIEDKVAATYDYAVIAQASADDNGIAYLELSGSQAEAPGNAQFVRSVIEGTSGVVAGSVRVSAAPAAASFAWQKRRYKISPLLEAINQKLARHGLKASVVRTWDGKQGLQ